jgi:type I restriction enzyme, S subunit
VWSGSAPLGRLGTASRWTVEFLGSGESQPAASRFAYPELPIGELVRERRDSVEPRDIRASDGSYIGLENVASLTGDLVVDAEQTHSPRSRAKRFRSGDILYARLRPYLNKVHYVEPGRGPGLCSPEFLVLVPDPSRVLPHFLRTLLASDAVLARACACQTGSALPRVHASDLLAIPVPVPPLEEQRRYEAFLDRAAARRRELARRLEALPRETLDSLTRALETGGEPAEP